LSACFGTFCFVGLSVFRYVLSGVFCDSRLLKILWDYVSVSVLKVHLKSILPGIEVYY